MRDPKELKVYCRSYDLTLEVYRAAGKFPPDERFGLTAHIRRTAISIPSNIAEGCGRYSKKELFHFMSIASGSLSELKCQLQIATDLGYLDNYEKSAIDILVEVDEVQRMLRSYMANVETGGCHS